MITPAHSARRVLGAFAVIAFTVSCGEPTGPIDLTAAPIDGALAIDGTSARPFQLVELSISGIHLPAQDTIAAAVGSTRIMAARVNDTTIALIVPNVPAGEQDVRVAVDDKVYGATLTVAAAITNSQATVDSMFAAIDAHADELEASIATSNAADTTGLRATSANIREAVATARTTLAGLAAADRDQALSYLAANAAAIIGAQVAAGGVATRDETSPGYCDPFTNDCFDGFAKAMRNGRVIARECAKKVVGLAALGGIAGGALGSLFGPAGLIAGIKIGAALGGASGAALCIYQTYSLVWPYVIAPMIANIADVVPGPRVSGGPTTAVYQLDVANDIVVQGTARSFVAGDASGAAATVIAAYDDLRSTWSAVLAELDLSSPQLPELPSSPVATTPVTFPASVLSVGAISDANVTATWTTSGDWRVTFANAKQGDDHEITFDVVYSQLGRADEQRELTVLLQPSQYAVGSVTVDPAAVQLSLGGSASLTATVADSSGDELIGRMPAWSSSQESVATVGATTGTVTAVGRGTATITAASGGTEGQAIVTVTEPDSAAIYAEAVLGFWTVSLNGQSEPYQLEILPDGAGIYHTGGGFDYRMSWGIIRRTDGRYYFTDSGFWNGWVPTGALSMPLSSFSAKSPCCDDVVSYHR